MSPLRTRILLSALTGLAVAGIAMFVAWDSFAHEPRIRVKPWITQRLMEKVQLAIQQYEGMNHRLPPRLQDLRSVEARIYLDLDDPRGLLDAWDRPFAYATNASTYVLTSLGRDGRPGGAGLDTDLSSDAPDSLKVGPTFMQFIFACPTQNMIGICLFAGFLSGCLCWSYAKQPISKGNNWDVLLVKILVTGLGAIIVAAILAPLHIPNGH